MPKKAPAPEPDPEPEPEPEGPSEEELQNIEDCKSLVESFADGALDAVKEKERVDLTFGVAARGVLSNAMGIVGQRFTHPDPGHSLEDQAGAGWACDEEPTPSRLDTWARGAVPVRIRPKLKIDTSLEDDEGLPNGMSTGRSMRSTRSVGSRKSSRAASANSKDGEPKTITAHSKPQPPKPSNRQDEMARATMKERTDKEARVAGIEAAYNEERAKIVTVLSELKGTEYGYNHKGEIIMLESVSIDRLPSQDVHLRVGLWSEADQEGGEGEVKGKRKKAARKGGGRGVEAAAAVKQQGSVVSAGAMQGSVVETIEMKSGVVLRSGETEKRGPNQKKDPMRMSRKDYNKMLSGTGTFEMEPLNETQKTWDNGDDEEVYEEEEEEEPDWMADARPATPMAAEEEVLPQGLANHIEFNQSIIGAPDWGQTGAGGNYRPQMPPGKEFLQSQRDAAIGHPHRLPRERPFDKVPGISTYERSKLPAPIYPAAKGHGFQLGYLGGEHSFVEASQQASFAREENLESVRDDVSGGIELPPIAGARSFSSGGRGKPVRRSFSRHPPSHIENNNPGLSRKYLGVKT